MPTPRRVLVCLALAVSSLLFGCGEDDQAGPGGAPRLKVVATTTQAADLARNVAPDAEVLGLLPANADPHEYDVRPRDIEALSDATLVVRSGGELDEWLAEAIESSGTKVPVLTLIDSVNTIEGGAGHAEETPAGEEEHADEKKDAHWWQDPRNGVLAATALGEALAKSDPAAAADYRSGAEQYAQRLRALDAAIARCWLQVPDAQRKLVTTHDALGYYAERYGLEVTGTVIPSLSTAGQPSVGETAELIKEIERQNVSAIFAESSVNAKVEQAIAREAGAKVGRALWADTLGPSGSDGATYLQSLASNTRAIVDGVTEGQASCSLPS